MERLKHLFFQLVVAFSIVLLLFAVPQSVQAEEQSYSVPAYITMYRLYNPYSGEHLYTQDTNEVSVLTKLGWKKEGEAWKAAIIGKAVLRLYNPNNGDHHYTLDTNEYNTLGKIGWRKEGIAWFSDDDQGVPVYRLFNPSQTGAGSHHYTTDKNEYKVLKTKGWRQEGISWYGVDINNIGTTTDPTPDDTTTTTPEPDDTTTTEPEPQAQYSYELYSTSTTFYSNYLIPIFIKTDNPDKSTFSLSYDGGLANYTGRNDYDDVQYLDNETTGIRKVKGGYLANMLCGKGGTYTISVTEKINGEIEGLGKVTVTLQDAGTLAKEWQYSVIEQATTSDMDPFEKMEAICSYLLSEFKYLKNDGDSTDGKYYVHLVSDENLPYFVKKEWDSYTSPCVLCEIAAKIGGFDEIYNCYFGEDWGLHYLARLTIGDETRYFHALPNSPENVVTNVEEIDWFSSNKLVKL